MFEIVKKSELAVNTILFEIKAPRIAQKANPGQFVIVRLNSKGERFPLTIADFDREQETITLVVQLAGYSTKLMGEMQEGQSILNIAGPLGHPSVIESNKKVVLVGGGLGIAPIYPIARAFKKAGGSVYTIIGAKSDSHLFWEDKLAGVSEKLLVTTDDGSKGAKGFVTNALQELLAAEKFDLVYAIGPGIMMSAVAKVVPGDIQFIVSLNSLMVDGTGMCGSCRATVGGETKFTCVDGPEFDGHKVDYEEFLNRLNVYKEEEDHICKIGLDEKGV